MKKAAQERKTMENRGRSILAVIFAACFVAIAIEGRLHWGDYAIGGKHHKMRAMEITEEVLKSLPAEKAEESVEKAYDIKAEEEPDRSTGRESNEGAKTGQEKESGGNVEAEFSEEPDEESDEEWEREFLQQYRGDFEKECQIEDGRIRFRMVVLDAALGSRWYGLIKSVDRGLSWQVVSSAPFDGDMGQGIDFIFLDEALGFATLMHNGGDEAYLYMTENGGESYQMVAIQGPEVTLDNGYQYYPYDYPEMPYEEDGKLYVLCGQGADGDYAGGDAAGMALFESTDGGHTFVYQYVKKGEGD